MRWSSPTSSGSTGPLWLAVQQRLYQGWGPLIGGPTEIGALLLNLALAFAGVAPLRRRAPWLLAACVYAGMIAVFFTFNAPVNAAVSHWTPEGLPPDWPAYRSRWEFGHALAAALAIAGLALTFWGFEWNRKR